MSDATSQTVYFYNRHPISCEIILTKLHASRGHLDGLRPEELFPHDQDHYGGLAATDELARGAQVSNGSRVADFCAGLGGTVRYLAHKYGADVTGIKLTPARVSGAQELIRRVGLHGTARIVEGNVMDVPLPDASIDAVVSQEAFCHVPDVKRAVTEAFRILRTDGRLAFTDWIANQPLTANVVRFTPNSDELADILDRQLRGSMRVLRIFVSLDIMLDPFGETVICLFLLVASRKNAKVCH